MVYILSDALNKAGIPGGVEARTMRVRDRADFLKSLGAAKGKREVGAARAASRSHLMHGDIEKLQRKRNQVCALPHIGFQSITGAARNASLRAQMTPLECRSLSRRNWLNAKIVQRCPVN
jgi:hypothetical protein